MNNRKLKFDINLLMVKRDIIYYLSKSNILAHLEEKIVEFEKYVKNPDKRPNFFIYELKLNLMLASTISGFIFNTLNENPLLFKKAVREVIYLMVKDILHPIEIRPTQIVVSIIPSSLPILKKSLFKSQKFCSFEGVLTSQTLRKKYILGSVWECELHNEPFYAEGAPEKCPNCILCTNQLVEKVESQDRGDLVFGLFVNKEALQMNKQQKIYEVVVKVTDSCISNLELGSSNIVTGILTSTVFIAWNCEKTIPTPVRLESENSILRLHRYLSGSPWMFSYALAMRLGKNIYSSTSFLHLKLGILLSLTSFKLNSTNMAIPILAIGEDTIEAHSLFNSVFEYTDRCLFHSQGQDITIGVRKNEWRDAGQLLLAGEGVYYLGDWDKYNKAEKEGFKIRSALESGCIHFDEYNIPLRCAVWTYWRKPRNQKDLTKLQALIDVFGMPFVTRKDDLSDCINFLNQNEKTIGTLDEHIHEYIQLVNSSKVSFTEEAEQLIKDYFVASRSIRHACLPIRALTFLTCLSETYARLNLKSEVLADDVVAVIALYEESLQYLYGACPISPAPLQHITDLDQVDTQMSQFRIWLKDYVDTIKR